MGTKEKSQGKTRAAKADKYVCYQKSVQSPEHEVEFFDFAYKDFFGRKPVTLREDFCGTFSVCCEWVKLGRNRSTIGVDLDPEPLDWGRRHNLSKLSESQQARVRLLQEDVRRISRPQVDVLAAQNFSFWIFKTRDEVIEYFKAARSNLAKDGIMIMDMMGGSDCFVEDLTDKRTIKKGKKGFKYYWKQESFNPINHDAEFSISFRFSDGSKMKRAFVYQWRFWSIPEVQELLAEAGFSESHVYWEETDEDDEDTGVYSRTLDTDSDPSWICYIVAAK